MGAATVNQRHFFADGYEGRGGGGGG
eukprot:COSAG01_NODE_81695_length_109_cov_117.300000_1_plen_25_part_01